MGGDLDTRLTRLEQRPQASRATWRATLAAYFAAPEYDAHREQLIAALTSDMPRYTFDTPTALYVVSWPARAEGGAPHVKRILLGTEDAPVPPPPGVLA